MGENSQKEERRALALEEIILRIATQVGILGRVILDTPVKDPNRISLRSALRTSCSIINSGDPKTVLENIAQGFSMARGQFIRIISLFEVLRDCGLAESLAPTFDMVGLSESSPSELGFVFRAEGLKLLPKNENAKIVIEKLIEIARERKQKREILHGRTPHR